MVVKRPTLTKEALKKALQCCSKCLKVPIRCTLIFRCVRGHMICTRCRSGDRKCPICKSALRSKRTIWSESHPSFLPTACKFREYGCAVERLPGSLNTHQEKCLYRLVECPISSCDQMVPFIRLLQHTKSGHRTYRFQTPINGHGIDSSSETTLSDAIFSRSYHWPSFYLTIKEHHFVWNCWRRENGHWLSWVKLIGSSEEASHYFYQITLCSGDKTEKLVYRGDVQSVEIPKATLAEDDLGMVARDAIIKRIADKSGGLLTMRLLLSLKQPANPAG